MDRAAQLREAELRAIRIQLKEGLGENALKSLDERGGAQELVREQYSGRYPFELLQNANDAAIESGKRGRVRFILTDSALLVADNGFGFGIEQVDAICSLGRSSKEMGSTVGYKGLGFKSVGEITDRPQITSGQTSFQFDAERVHAEVGELFGEIPAGQHFPVYAFPFPVTDADLGDDAAEVRQLLTADFTTVIRLPLRDSVEREVVANHLVQHLRPRLLLFLQGVDHLELRGTHADFSVEVGRDDEDGAEHVLLDVDDTTEEWLIYRHTLAPSPELLKPLGAAWADVERVRLGIAVPLDDSGQPRTDDSYPLHVYFPTEEVPGLHVAVHAEWALTMDRRSLATTPEAAPYNRWLQQQVATFAADQVAADVVERFGHTTRSVQVVTPATARVSLGTGLDFQSLWSRALSDVAFMPAADDSLQPPARIQLLPKGLPSLEEAHRLAEFDPTQVLRPDVEQIEPIRTYVASVSKLGEMAVGAFVEHLRRPRVATLATYYDFLIRWKSTASGALVSELRKRPSVLTTRGDLLAPETDTVFLPRQRGDRSTPARMPVPIARVPDVPGLENFLKEIGVREFQWRELIREFLIKILDDPEADDEARARAMEGLRAYAKARVSGSEELVPVLGRVLLPVRSADGSMHQLRPASRTYFGREWTGDSDLELVYGPFGEAEFLDEPVPEDPERARTDVEFFRMLGVQDHPRLDIAETKTRDAYMVGNSWRHPHCVGLFNRWLSEPDVAKASVCVHHPASQQIRSAARLDRHEEIVESADPRRLLALWTQLANAWGAVYEPAMESVFYCQHQGHAGNREHRCVSLFAYTLQSQPWVPVDRGNTTDLVVPAEAWIDSPETPRRIKERIPRISEAMYRMRGGTAMASALELTDAARPTADDLLALLDSVASEADEAGDSNHELELAARWVQRTLNDVLSDPLTPHPEPDTVRLLATRDGETAFVAQPAYADDPLLRDTWEKQGYILAAESGLNRLTRFLSLLNLDSVVDTSALAYGQHTDDAAARAVQQRINRLKPYLLALIRAENPRAETTARPALTTLELVVCDELVLRYQYDGLEVERKDATCHIATSRQPVGRRNRVIGTAYLELDPDRGQPHWFPVGRQLAQFLGVPGLADAVTMLLITTTEADRERMMADRQIQQRDIDEARVQLRLPPEEDDLFNAIDSLIASAEEGLVPPAPASGAAVPVHTPLSPPASGPMAGPPAPPDPPATDGPARQPPLPPPAIDYAQVKIVDATPGTLSVTTAATGYRGGSGGGSASFAIQNPEEDRRVGKRGEEAVYNAERLHLEAIGKDPELVTHVSRANETAPYDIRSVDDDDQVIYIEVKSTKGTDPSEPFFISHGELVEAAYRGPRYYIYRVTDVDSAVPQIVRAANPLQLVREHRGRLQLAKAQMTLVFDAPER